MGLSGSFCGHLSQVLKGCPLSMLCVFPVLVGPLAVDMSVGEGDPNADWLRPDCDYSG